MKSSLDSPARITLLSTSPRRREIISALKNPTSTSNEVGDEPRPEPDEPAEEYVVRSAVAKLEAARKGRAAGWLVAADTVVVIDDRILGKPTTDAEARLMLASLRSRWHQVTTGVAVADTDTGRLCTGTETSQILTRDYSDRAMEAYVASNEPLDKAGAYAVQDRYFKPVLKVEGCYLNVVGLPLCLAATLLTRLGAEPKLHPLSRIPYYGQCTDCKLGGPREDTT